MLLYSYSLNSVVSFLPIARNLELLYQLLHTTGIPIITHHRYTNYYTPPVYQLLHTTGIPMTPLPVTVEVSVIDDFKSI